MRRPLPALRPLLLAAVPLACASPAPPPEVVPHRPTPAQRFFEWTRPSFPTEVLVARRAALARAIGERGGGVLLVPSGDGSSHGETFRQLDDFLYLCGLELPSSVLAMEIGDGTTATLYVPLRDARFENPARPNDYPGRTLARDPALKLAAGVDAVRPYADLQVAVARWAEQDRTLWVDPGRATLDPSVDPTIEAPSDFVRTYDAPQVLLLHLAREHPEARVASAFEPMARLRMVKGPEEIAILRRACAITAAGMRVAARSIRDGVDERTLEGELEAAFKSRGAQRPAFDSIIKSGPNSLWPWRILAAHYDRRNRRMRDGELVIFDVGCELDHYASDVGRTFPVSGHFTPEQRRLVQMVTDVSDAIMAAVRPGATFAELRLAAYVAIPEWARPYMQTGLFFGHHIGLAVGDASLEDVPLQPGAVFTIEPWYYDHDRGVAVFIEDDVLVTETGVENLTRSLARDPAGLQRMVGER